MAQHHHYSISEIEDMLPFERDIYIDLLKNYLEQESEKQLVVQKEFQKQENHQKKVLHYSQLER
jgi:hypothetical protein